MSPEGSAFGATHQPTVCYRYTTISTCINPRNGVEAGYSVRQGMIEARIVEAQKIWAIVGCKDWAAPICAGSKAGKPDMVSEVAIG